MRLMYVLLCVFFYSGLAQAMNVQVQGLFKGAAVLTIDGKQRLLKAGNRSPEGVLLISATPKKAIVDIDGVKSELTLSQQISSNYTESTSKSEVSIRRNRADQYITTAVINGKRRQVLVDTGANIVAISGRDARALNLDYRNGQPSRVITASGEAPAYRMSLRSVSVGDIRLNGVDATIIDGDHPEVILLGMSFLKRVNMREENGVLYLQGKF